MRRVLRRQLIIIATAFLLAESLITAAGPAHSAFQANSSQHTVSYGIRVELLATDPDLILNGVTAMNLSWIAQDVNWATIEPSRGNYQWAMLDTAITATEPFDVQVLLSIAGAPAWARPIDADLSRPGPPADLGAFANFVSQVAWRYAGRVAAYEIWPGANTATAWSSPEGLSPQRYTELVRRSRQAIKAVDPLAIVLGGSLTPIAVGDGVNTVSDLVFLEQMYVIAGAQDAFDALSVRLNGYNNPPNDAPGQLSGPASEYTGHSAYFFRHYESVYQVMLAQQDAEKAIWITGASWASSTVPVAGAPYAIDVTEAQQAEYLVAAIEQVDAQIYIDALIIDNFNFAVMPDRDAVSAARSLIHNDWSARPAFVALAQIRQQQDEPPLSTLPDPIFLLPNWSPRLPD